MDDNTDIAILAASVEREMRQGLAGSQGLRYNRTDFRNFLNGHPNVQQPQPMHPAHQYHGQYNHNYGPPPQQYYPQQGLPPPQGGDDLVIPEGTLNGPIKQYVVPAHLQLPNQGGPQVAPMMEPSGGFVMPNYNASSQKVYLEDEQEFRDALIKEIKSQKKSLNKLIKTNEQLILTVDTLTAKIKEMAEKLKIELEPEPIPENIIDEVKDKS
jgi:hypothetical protein